MGPYNSGQVLVHQRLADDVRQVFSLMLNIQFPLESVIPISHPQFAWNDFASMEANNSSAFNFRTIAGTAKLSQHSWGRALDLNPRQNPWIRGKRVDPKNASYDPQSPGTFHDDHPVVVRFRSFGWEWGGNWSPARDYHHFQKLETGVNLDSTLVLGKRD